MTAIANIGGMVRRLLAHWDRAPRRGMVPGSNDKSPAAIAAHRARGRVGYMNRRWRSWLESESRQWDAALDIMEERLGTLRRLAGT